MKSSENASRRKEIAQVLARNGFQGLWDKWGFAKVFGAVETHFGREPVAAPTQPVRLRQTLEQLGTTAIKLGQALSTRPDLLPPEYISELSKLQDDVPKVPYHEVAAAITRELGDLPENVFQSIDANPRAAGSIAQVHSATLQDGTNVVVKVRRPGIEEQVERDLAILGQIARLFEQNTSFGKRYGLAALVDEFGNTLRNELDFTREGHNAERIAAQFSNDEFFHAPTIYWEFSSHTVLTMEDIHGIKIDDLEALDAAGIDRHALAERCAHIALVQVLDNGFFHADPHPGNFFVQEGGVIALLDYGMVGRLGDHLRASLLRLAMATSHRDSQRIVDELLALGAARGHVDRNGLERDVDHMLEQYDGLSIGEISIAQLVRDITAMAQRYALVLPSDLVVLARVVGMDEGLGAKIDPGFNLMEYSKPYFEEFWRKSHSLKAIAGQLRGGAIDLAQFAKDFPERLVRLTGMVERGDLTVTSRVELPDATMKGVHQVANRVAISVLAAGIIVGLSVLAQVYQATAADALLKVFLILGVVSAGWLLISFWKSTR